MSGLFARFVDIHHGISSEIWVLPPDMSSWCHCTVNQLPHQSLLPVTNDSNNNNSTTTTAPTPAPRNKHSTVVTSRDHLIVFGGETEVGIIGELWMLKIDREVVTCSSNDGSSGSSSGSDSDSSDSEDEGEQTVKVCEFVAVAIPVAFLLFGLFIHLLLHLCAHCSTTTKAPGNVFKLKIKLNHVRATVTLLYTQ